MRYANRGDLDAQHLHDLAWESFLAGNLDESLATLARMTNRDMLPAYALESPFSSERRQVCACLLAYDYPHLENITDSVRREFAIVSAWNALLTHFTRFDVWDRAEPLSVILGAGYTLNIDVERIWRATWGEVESNADLELMSLPFSYEQFMELWPQSCSLPSLSLGARSSVVRAVLYGQQSSLVDYERLGPEDIPELAQCLRELNQAGLIDPNPTLADLLMNSTAQKLKQFAYEHGLASHGPKHRLVEEITASVEPQLVEEFLRSLGLKTQVRLMVPNLPSVKKFLWAESRRLGQYLFWIKQIHCLNLHPVSYEPQEASCADTDMQPWVRMSEDPIAYLSQSWSQAELRLVRGLWDEHCDAIVIELASKYAWDAPWYFSEAILAYLSSKKRQAFEKAWEEKRTRANALMYYGEARLVQIGVKIRDPRLLKCKGCGKQFKEWSIHTNTAKGVGYRIHFCSSCYARALNSARTGLTSLSRDEMISALIALATALEAVPTATFVRRPTLESVSDEKQIAIVKALHGMAPYEAYVEAFGSWLKALYAARILTSGKENTVIGTRCIALDGHECHSLAEKSIDDWFSARGVEHEREPLYPYHARLNPTGRMRADWAIQQTFIEYAGLMDEPEYAAKMETKQKLAAEFGIDLIIVEPDSVLDLDSLFGHLLPV